MSYRPTALQNKVICDVASLVEIHVLNGTTSEIVVPCSYVVDGMLVPIDLVAEGYSNPRLAVDRLLDGLAYSVVMSGNEFRLSFNSSVATAITSDVERSASLLVDYDVNGVVKTGAVIRIKLVVVAGPISEA